MLQELNIPFVEDVGEAAFYGPKVDINAKNVYGKEDTRTCSGHSHVGNIPAYFSISHASVLS